MGRESKRNRGREQESRKREETVVKWFISSEMGFDLLGHFFLPQLRMLLVSFPKRQRWTLAGGLVTALLGKTQLCERSREQQPPSGSSVSSLV